MIRFYLLPIERNGANRGPKYFSWSDDPDPPGIVCRASIKDYGSIDMGVVCADITQADHDSLVLHPDVYAFPENLDAGMAQAEKNALNTYLESNAVPADWLKVGDTFRAALRVVTAMFLYMQRVLAILLYPANPFAGLTLNTQYQSIPNPLHDALAAGAISLGYTWNVSPNDQVRKVFKTMADQWGGRPILFGSLATL